MLWIVRGPPEAPGWKALLADAKDDKIDWRLLDRDAFVIVRSEDPPEPYDGMTVGEPVDGLYVDQQGNHLFIVNREEVADAAELIAALGEEAQRLYDQLGDELVVLQRLGKAY